MKSSRYLALKTVSLWRNSTCRRTWFRALQISPAKCTYRTFTCQIIQSSSFRRSQRYPTFPASKDWRCSVQTTEWVLSLRLPAIATTFFSAFLSTVEIANWFSLTMNCWLNRTTQWLRITTWIKLCICKRVCKVLNSSIGTLFCRLRQPRSKTMNTCLRCNVKLSLRLAIFSRQSKRGVERSLKRPPAWIN